MSHFNRREFFQQAAATTGALAAAPIFLRSPLLGADAPSNKLNIAIIGPGGAAPLTWAASSLRTS